MAPFNVDGHIEQRYKIISHIGSGAYGVVWCALDRQTSGLVALKKVFDAFGNQQDAQRTYREVMLLNALHHGSIIRLTNMIRSVNDADLYLAFELAETDLSTILHHNVLLPVHQQYLAYQVVKTVAYLHSRGVLHRDLKPANIFVNSDCGIKLGDFGLARCAQAQGEDVFRDLTGYVATRWYRAPELLVNSANYTTAMDIWAVGCIIYELLTSSPLFMGRSTLHQLSLIIGALGEPTTSDLESLGSNEIWPLMDASPAIKSHPLQENLREHDPDAVDLICKLVVFNPNKRLTARGALRHPYFAPFFTDKDIEELDKAEVISLPLPDEKNFAVAEYREALYEVISRCFRQHASF
ncbi:map-kinase like proteinue [Trypanosoma rangeli]|uniref:Mitogen-activated protein kinase n=1 Tax=Trypanosoma rangeli TaxID=5698 RepID=A0A3R7KDC2_TRYRA|nr:map-kinase like proteinue [Trypanosoma rangeli]RNF05797.1 map-kinase like proteinue [Trypanosoma rangeli]|eukprot:RNF05797.1 map-kinase like proteinue [Trypanosoma rangeli]